MVYGLLQCEVDHIFKLFFKYYKMKQKLKKILFFLSILGVLQPLSGQSLEWNKKLPSDTTIVKGVLDNGLTYYIKNTDVVKDAASFYLVQNVGSVLEKENEQGLAHFLEHMAFNGTKAFPGKSLLNTLERLGLSFGDNINAYTSFDETVYNIDNVPTSKEGVDTALQVLFEWCNGLLLETDEIDAERGVVKEEWRGTQNADQKVYFANLKTTFDSSRYTQRFPMGKMDIVESFEPAVLRDFYKTWYRTDLQAVVIVGDLNVSAIEQQLKALFSTIPAVDNPQERFTVSIKDTEELNYGLTMNKEVAASKITFSIRYDKPSGAKTVLGLKKDIMTEIVNNFLNRRFSKLILSTSSPCRDIGIAFQPLALKYDNLSLIISPIEGKQQEAFEFGMQELYRGLKFGPTETELKSCIEDLNDEYENNIARLEEREHSGFITDIQLNYLEGKSIVDPIQEFEYAKKIMATLTVNDIIEHLKELYQKKNRSVVVTGVEGSKNLTSEEASTLIEKVENNPNLKPIEENEEISNIMEGIEAVEGTIVSKEKNTDLNFTTYVLSNGIKVHFKPSKKVKEQISLEAISKGGTSLLKDEYFASAYMAAPLVSLSGLNTFSGTEIYDFLNNKFASVSLNIGSINESLSGFASPKDLEIMMQLVYLHFTKPRFDKASFDFLLKDQKQELRSRRKDVFTQMEDSTLVTIYGKNHPRQRLFNNKFIEEIDFEKAKQIYKERFGNPGDFEFFFVGDADEKNLELLLKKYIAGLSVSSDREVWKDKTAQWVSNTIDKKLYLPMESSAVSVGISHRQDLPYSLKDYFMVKALGGILQLRYTETLREKERGTYTADVRGYFIKHPKSYGGISINFQCNPDLTDKLIGLVDQELENMKNGIIPKSDIKKVKANLLKERKYSQSTESFDMVSLKNYVLEGYNMNDYKKFENIIDQINAESLTEIANKVLKNNQSYKIVIYPLTGTVP